MRSASLVVIESFDDIIYVTPVNLITFSTFAFLED